MQAAAVHWNVIREKCPGCDAAAFAPYAAVRRVDAVRCPECGLVYVRAVERAPETPAESFTGLYDERYFDKYLRRGGYEWRVRRDRGRVRLLQRYQATGRLLDVGCSIGHFMEAARNEGWETFGVEPSRFAADFAARRGGSVTCGVLEDTAFPDDHFDMVTMWHVIEHVPDPRATITEVRRILKPGGLLALLTPNIGHLMARFHGPRWKHIHEEHLQLFSHHTLPPFLARMGFDTVHRHWLCRHSETLVLARNRTS